MKAQGKWRYSATLFFNLGTRWGWVVNAMSRPLCPRPRDAVTIVQETGYAAGPV